MQSTLSIKKEVVKMLVVQPHLLLLDIKILMRKYIRKSSNYRFITDISAWTRIHLTWKKSKMSVTESNIRKRTLNLLEKRNEKIKKNKIKGK